MPPDRSSLAGGVHQRLIHDSAVRHVTGEAVYIDDMAEPSGVLHLCPGLSRRAHARIISIDREALLACDGVVAVLTDDDVPGANDFGHAGRGDDKVFADTVVDYHGQAVFAVLATSYEAARRAAALDVVSYEDLAPVLTIEDAMAAESFLAPPFRLVRGDTKAALAEAPCRLTGTFRCGGQEHFYLEPQVAMSVPGEDGTVHVYSSTQDPSAVQHLLARVLGRPANAVTIEVRRLGGGFGGKETVATQFAAMAAVASLRTGRSVKCRLDRDDDMIMTGKRHAFRFDYDVGFTRDGLLAGIELSVAANCGYSEDQSLAVLARAIFHCDNAYYLPNVTITGYPCRTNICTGCAFRGFGSPQGNIAIERVMNAIAHQLGRDPWDIRRLNLYGDAGRDVTHYDWPITDNVLPRILEELRSSSDFVHRRRAVRRFNEASPVLRRGIALTPLKYGVGFSAAFLNQAGALIHIYQDGSIQLNHGGTEMGQGLYVKVAQIVAEELQVDIDRIRITGAVTDKVPNTTATAASSGTDMNGAAAQIAARTLKSRLADFAAESHKVPREQVVFANNRVRVGNADMSFDELVGEAYRNLVSLSSTGFYSNPAIDVDFTTMKGRPYHYNAYGAAVVEVEIDTLTGESRVLRVDILHDVGKSLNPAIDLGQLEGGFMQGIGWLTMEELVWDSSGRLLTHAPSTYKIPACSDRPDVFNMRLVDWNENREDTVFRSKAIGEPPFNLAISVFNALTDAVSSVADHRRLPDLDAPATPERILLACERLRGLSRDVPLA